MSRRGYQRCVNVEEIPDVWGGGHLCTGRCGLVHLHGRAWSWWQCPVCNRRASTQRLRNNLMRQIEYWYAPLEPQVQPESVKRRAQRQRLKEQRERG